jgi:hypothetical protein
VQVIHLDQQLSAASVYERSALIRYATMFYLQHSSLTPCMPMFTRKADGITSRSPEGGLPLLIRLTGIGGLRRPAPFVALPRAYDLYRLGSLALPIKYSRLTASGG